MELFDDWQWLKFVDVILTFNKEKNIYNLKGSEDVNGQLYTLENIYIKEFQLWRSTVANFDRFKKKNLKTLELWGLENDSG